MKKIFSTGFAGSFLFIVTHITASGQIAKTNSEVPSNTPSFGKVSVNDSPVVVWNTIDTKALRNFYQSFKSANETWYTAQNGFAAAFRSNDVDYLVSYDKKGNWIHTVRTYGEANLQADLRHIIKSNYYDYQINLVNEIESPFSPLTYIVQLLGKTKLINLRISNGDIEEWQKFNRSE